MADKKNIKHANVAVTFFFIFYPVNTTFGKNQFGIYSILLASKRIKIKSRIVKPHREEPP